MTGDDVFPLEDCLREVAQRIAAGIAGSAGESNSQAGFGDSLVYLPVLIAKTVEKSTHQEDPYWCYYASCDTWDVVLARGPHLAAISNRATTAKRREFDFQSVLQQVITKLRTYYLQLEFEYIECLGIRQTVRTCSSPHVPRSACESPVASLLATRQTSFSSLWADWNSWLEMTSRLIFELKTVSWLKNQSRDSTTPAEPY